MPDIPNKEKQEIRILAEDFSCLIATLSFKKGSYIFYEVFKSLYSRSARWRYCLICGNIDLPKDFIHKDPNYPQVSCHKIQSLIPTSWMKLRDFFIKGNYKKLLKAMGVQNVEKKTTSTSN